MAKQKENPLDNLGDRLREIIKEIEGLLFPQPPKRARVPIPVPVEVPQRRTNRRPY